LFDDVLLHIGYHKTGTTWMQDELFSKSDSFIFRKTLARNFIYNEKGFLLSSLDDNEEVIQRKFDRFIKKKLTNRESILCVSHERLSGNPHSSGFDASVISRRLKNVFPNAKVLIVIREQSAWLLSNYFQYLSAGGTYSITKYLNSSYDGKRPGFAPYHIEYHHLIKKYSSLFGKENVLVLPYELFKQSSLKFIKEFDEFLSIETNLDEINTEVKINAKSNFFINYKLRALNNILIPSSLNNCNTHNRFLMATASTFKTIATTLAPQNLDDKLIKKLRRQIDDWAKDRYCQSNQTTQILTGLNLFDYGYKMSTSN